MADTPIWFHEDCGMPWSEHDVICPGATAGITPESLRAVPQPQTLEEWIGQAIGAATTIPYGPGVTSPFDERSARNILAWAVEGIRNLETSNR